MSWRQRPGFKRSDLFQDFSEVLAAGYENFQHIAIALETVLNGVNATRVDYIRKMGNFWKVSYQAAIRVVEATYLTLKSDPMLEDLDASAEGGQEGHPAQVPLRDGREQAGHEGLVHLTRHALGHR